MAIVVGELSVIEVVALWMMGLQMPVDRRVRMIGVRFVEVFARERQRKREVRRQDETDDSSPV